MMLDLAVRVLVSEDARGSLSSAGGVLEGSPFGGNGGGTAGGGGILPEWVVFDREGF